jgi:hypothetical protein
MGWYAPDYDVYNAFPEIAANEQPATSWKDRDYALTEACKANLKPSTEPLRVPFEQGSIWKDPGLGREMLAYRVKMQAEADRKHPHRRAVEEQREIETKADMVNQPSHYARFVIEPATYVAANGLGFVVGNAIKYISRAGFKGGPEKHLEDLKKAIRCIEMEIECVERKRRIESGENKNFVWSKML